MIQIGKCVFICLIFCFFLRNAFTLAQTFPQDFDYSRYSEILIDAGEMWAVNSVFHPLSCFQTDDSLKSDSLAGAFQGIYRHLKDYSSLCQSLRDSAADGFGVLLFPGMGMTVETGSMRGFDHLAVQPFFLAEVSFKRNLYAKLYFRGTNEDSSLPHYTGVSQDISRAGMKNGEIDRSVIGYRNDWMMVEYGRSREIWGPFAENNLLLAGNAPSYERIMLQFNYRKFTCRWFYGFLESVFDQEDVNINRYLVGRVLEYRNGRNLVISAGEVSVLAGANRALDMAFLNPLALHLEIEQNQRENNNEDNYSNDILFLNIDWLTMPTLRISGSFTLDEFQIDSEDREEKSDALGYAVRYAWTPSRKTLGLTLFGYFTRMDTYVMQHEYAYSNLVTRGELIGHSMGNDADDIASGARLVFAYPYPALMEVKFGRRRWGSNSLLDNPYAAYNYLTKVSFPSGEVKTNTYLNFLFNVMPFRNISFTFSGHVDINHSGEDSALEKYILSLRYQLPLLFNL